MEFGKPMGNFRRRDERRLREEQPAPTDWREEKRRAEDICADVRGVVDVRNELRIEDMIG